MRPWLEARGVRGPALDIAHYVTTEMLNNVRDHSDSPDVEVMGEVGARGLVVHGPGFRCGAVFSGSRPAWASRGRVRLWSRFAAKASGRLILRITPDKAFFCSSGVCCDWYCVEANGFGVLFERVNGAELLQFPNWAGGNAGTG